MPAIGQDVADGLLKRFERFASVCLTGLTVNWDSGTAPGTLLGTAQIGMRKQPFRLQLSSHGTRAVVRCRSHIGVIKQERLLDFAAAVAHVPIRVSGEVNDDDGSCDAYIEEVLVLPDSDATDAERIAWVVLRVSEAADLLERTHLIGQDEDLAALRRHESGEAGDVS